MHQAKIQITLGIRIICANAHADLNLRWAHISESMFCDVEAKIITKCLLWQLRCCFIYEDFANKHVHMSSEDIYIYIYIYIFFFLYDATHFFMLFLLDDCGDLDVNNNVRHYGTCNRQIQLSSHKMNRWQAELATLSQKRWQLCYPNLTSLSIYIFFVWRDSFFMLFLLDDCGGLDVNNNVRHYDTCNSKKSCRSPVTRMLTPANCSSSDKTYPMSTNYMVVEYYCIPGMC